MRTFRKWMRGRAGRAVTLVLLAATAHVFADPRNYLFALEAQRAKEAQIRTIAKNLNVDPEFLLNPNGRQSFDFRKLFAQVGAVLGLSAQVQPATSESASELRDQIAMVKSRYALVAADTTLSKLAELVTVSLSSEATRGKKKGRIKSEMQSVLRLVEKDFLPPLPEALPSAAASRDATTRAALKKLREDVKALLNSPRALDDQNIDATLGQLRQVVSGSLRLPGNGRPRWEKDPFPVRDTYRAAPTTSLDRRYGGATGSSTTDSGSSAIVAGTAAPPPAALKLAPMAVASEVANLAQQLATPAKAFAFVYDQVEWQSYGGVAKGALGTLQERRGNDWDQALLLRDLLQAQGYQAQLEWGKVSLPIARAMNLVGTEDPMQAANLMATAGMDSVAVTQNGSPVLIQMTHPWVRAFIPYVPNRGATAGTADTWVRMDPSFKRYEYQEGINIPVSWNESEYLHTSTIRPPNDFHADKVWAYIRANNLNCENLGQVPKTGRVRQANYPFVPATLNARIEQILGTGAEPPATLMQTVTITVSDPVWGETLTSYSSTLAQLWGRKLSITFPPATADDAAIIARYGGLYNTPAYLVRLKAVIAIDDQPVAQGGAAAAGADLSLDLQFREPRFGVESTHHQIIAGESMTEVFDSGRIPDSLIAQRIARLQGLSAQPPTTDEARAAIETEKLNIIGMRYMQQVNDAFDFAAGVRWHRWVKSPFEGLVSQRVKVSYNFVGSPIRISPADHNIDVTRVTVGIIPIRNDLSQRLNAMALAGLQSSYLEGSIWEEMESQQGISATKALLLSRMAGQQLHTADRTNVESVLATINLSDSAEAEIRGSVSQGRIAIVPSAEIRLNQWRGTGFILRDPIGGSTTYPISGGFAGGSSTGGSTSGPTDTLGNESWLNGSDFDAILNQIIADVGGLPSGSAGPVGVPSTIHGDPLNVATGNMYRSSTDLAIIARGQPVAVYRTYNSRSGYDGFMGFGWTSMFDETVVPLSTSALYRQADGTEHLFTRNSDGSYSSPPGVHLTLSITGAGATLRALEGHVRTFNGAGFLIGVTDPDGNTIDLVRDGAGNPTAVIDSSGRTVLTITTTEGRVTGITDLSGRTLAYAYDGDDLISYTDAAGKIWSYRYDLQHNMTQFIDPLGGTQSYDYDTNDRMFHHVDAVGAEEFFHYDGAGGRAVITDKRGGDRFIQFDNEGRAVLEADPSGNRATAVWDASFNRTTVVDSRGYTKNFTYDANGRITRESRPDGSFTESTWDSSGRPLVVTDATGVVTTNRYNTDGKLLETSRTVDGVAEVTRYTYDSYGQLRTVTDPNNNVSTTDWNDAGAVVARTNAANETTTITVDILGRATALKDAAGNVTTLSHDAKDRVVLVKDPYGRELRATFDAAGRRVSMSDGLGTTTYTYDREGRHLTTTDPMGFVDSKTYNAAGDLIAVTDRRGSTVRYEYDEVGRTRRMVDANGGEWNYDWCAAIGGDVGGSSCSTCTSPSGNSFCVLLDPNGNKITQLFDVMGRVTEVTDTMGSKRVVQYDRNGRRVAETDANGHTTRWTWNEAGRLSKVTEANGAITSYTYDGNGNKLTQTNPNGHVWSFKYDALNRLIEEKDPLQRKTTYAYDNIGKLQSVTNPANQTTRFTYNIARLTGVTYPDGTTEIHTYDTHGRRTATSNANTTLTFAYDLSSRLKSTTSQKVNTAVSYEYDGEGNRTRMTTLKGTVSYAYDAAERLISMTDPVFGQFRFAYDNSGRRTELRSPNGVRTAYQYDNANRMTALSTTASNGTVLDAWSYTYDSAGNRLSKTNMAGTAETYSFDEVHRLVSAQYPDGTRERYTYDPAGNRLSLTNEAAVSTNYTYDVANQLLTAGADSFSYDLRGNLTARTSPSGNATLAYDFKNRLTRLQVGSTVESSEYSPNGERVSIVSPSVEGTIRPVYDLNSNPILDFDSTNNLWIYRAYGPGMDEPLAEWKRTTGQTTYLHRDGLGSITTVSDSTGALLYRQNFSAFGRMSRTALPTGVTPTRLSFTARENSIGSYMQYRSRYYDTSTGRFTSQDEYRGDSIDPPSLHRYVYVNNDPVNYVDPTGNFPLTAAILMVGAAMAVMNGLIYYLFEENPQFGQCLLMVSGTIIPTIILLCAVFVTAGIWGLIISMVVGLWFILQNNCMFNRWAEQSSAAWVSSRGTCNTTGWTSTACCQSRISAEQRGYTECLSETIGFEWGARVVESGFPYKCRILFGYWLCRC